jgi:hypothetical protein
MSKVLLEFQTTQITAFKVSLEVIDSLITDTNLEVSNSGIRIRETNRTSKLFLGVSFARENFDSYILLQPFDTGIELSSLTGILKPALHYDSLTIQILGNPNSDKPEVLMVLLESFKRAEKKTIKLPLLPSCPNTCGDILDKVYSHSVVIPSDILVKYFKDISRVSDRVRLVLDKKNFMIESGCGVIQYILSSGSSSCIGITTECSSRINAKAEVLIRFLLLTSKLSSLSELTTIFLDKEDSIPTIRFNLGSLGVLNLCLF